MRRKLRLFFRLSLIEKLLVTQMIALASLMTGFLRLSSLPRLAGWLSRGARIPVFRDLPLLNRFVDLMSLARLSHLAVDLVPFRRGPLLQSLMFMWMVQSRGRVAQIVVAGEGIAVPEEEGAAEAPGALHEILGDMNVPLVMVGGAGGGDVAHTGRDRLSASRSATRRDR